MRLLFDAGDGLVSSLLGTAGRINHVFISHADRDHLTGLLQFNQLNAKPGHPNIYYPKDAHSISAFEQFSKLFDRKVAGSVWKGVSHNQVLAIRDDLQVTARRNGHVRAPADLVKSLGYLVQTKRRKLKPEYFGLTGDDIRNVRNKIGEEAITELVTENILGYSGDTPAENFDQWNGCRVLIHETTFIYKHELADEAGRYNLHSTLDEVIALASQLTLGALILGHFSSRYKPHEIDEAIKRFCIENKTGFPVYRLLPGVYYQDILATGSEAMIWAP